MPIYEYRCAACGHELEALQKFSEAPLTACPTCRKDALVKLVSAAGFQLKGSGWYATDFKGASKPAGKSSGGTNAEASAAPASETKSEAKSETKADAKPATPASGSGA